VRTPSLRNLVARLPRRAQHVLRELNVRRQLVSGRLISEEPDVVVLERYVRPGDVVLDVGANVGTYTLALSRLVGPRGRVIAIEPVPGTFGLLASSVAFAGLENVTLLNLAGSDRTGPIAMTVPRFASGLDNIYQASVSADGGDALVVHACRLDDVLGELPIAFAKIDVEGHEAQVLAGMFETLRRCRPRLLVECPSARSSELLAALGYHSSSLPGSPNTWFEAGPPPRLGTA